MRVNALSQHRKIDVMMQHSRQNSMCFEHSRPWQEEKELQKVSNENKSEGLFKVAFAEAG